MRTCTYIVFCFALSLQVLHAQAGLWDAIDSARKSVGSAVCGCSWKFPSGKRCGASTEGDSAYCKDHKCVKCNEQTYSNGYCQRHDPQSHEMCIWPSCGEPGEIRFRHKGGTFTVNGQAIPSESGIYCKPHYAQVTAKLVEVGCIDFYPEVYARFDDATRKKIDAALVKRSEENAKRKREKFEAQERAKLAEAENERIRRQKEEEKRVEADRQYWVKQKEQRAENAEMENSAKMAMDKKAAEQRAIARAIKQKCQKYGFAVSDVPFWKVASPECSEVKPENDTAYENKMFARVRQVVSGGVLVQIDDGKVFVCTDREYIDGDKLEYGWYGYTGRYTYTDANNCQRTIRKFVELK